MSKDQIEQLVVDCQGGDHEAFSRLYDHFVDKIYRYVFYRVKSDDSEDLVEDVFVKVWEKLNKYKSQKGASFSSWIFRIAHNRVVDYYRANKIDTVSDVDFNLKDENEMNNPKRSAENVLTQDALKAVLVDLKEDQRDVIIYKFINGMDNKEIADLLGKKEGNIRILQYRALKVLKDKLGDLGFSY